MEFIQKPLEKVKTMVGVVDKSTQINYVHPSRKIDHNEI